MHSVSNNAVPDQMLNFVEKLNAQNYATWKLQMEQLLIKQELLGVVKETKPTNVDPAWLLKDGKARAVIALSLEDNQLSHVMDKITAKEMWDQLAAFHDCKVQPKKVPLLRKLCSLRLSENGNMADHLQDITDLIERCSEMGEDVGTLWCIALILSSVPRSYATLVADLEDRPEHELTVDLVKHELLEEWERQKVKASTKNLERNNIARIKPLAAKEEAHIQSKCWELEHKPNNPYVLVKDDKYFDTKRSEAEAFLSKIKMVDDYQGPSQTFTTNSYNVNSIQFREGIPRSDDWPPAYQEINPPVNYWMSSNAEARAQQSFNYAQDNWMHQQRTSINDTTARPLSSPEFAWKLVSPSPFLGFLPAGLGLYRKVIIRGKMKEDQFNINFQSGPNTDPRDDCPLHISIRPRDKVIVRNTYQFRSWGIEERHGGCPIQKKGYFDVQITVKPDAYSIAINGCQYCEFAHRQPYASVRFIHIGEGAQVDAMITE